MSGSFGTRVRWLLVALFVYYIEVDSKKLVVVSFDAFKPSYLRITPKLQKFYEQGVLATRFNDSFPTKTFVNHFSIATVGLYPQHHGVTGNEVYDREYKRLFKYSYQLFHYNQSVTPIWTLNELQGKHTGCLMWPGSDFEYQGKNCSYFKAWVPTRLKERANIIVSWLTNATNPANFVMGYIEEPDEEGHAYSPDSTQEIKMLKKLDKFILYLEQALKKAGIQKETDIILLSDHGMSSVTPSKFINLFEFIDKDSCKTYGSSPMLQVVCEGNREYEACANLTQASNKLGTFKAYTDQQLLERWHVRTDQRFGPCAVVAEPGYGFQDMLELANWFYQKRGIKMRKDTRYGIHGYDNYNPDMKPIFLAKGPSFRKGVTLNDEFDNIDLYYLFCKLLNLECISVDGANRNDVWQKMLRSA